VDLERDSAWLRQRFWDLQTWPSERDN